MTTPRQGDPARGWLFVEKLLVDDEIARIEKLSDEEVLSEMGLLASHVPSAERLMEKAEARARIEPASVNGAATAARRPTPIGAARAKRRSQTLLWLLAAAFAIVVVVGFVERGEIVARFGSHPTPTTPEVPSPPDPAQRAVAAATRAEAQKACAEGAWIACLDKLVEAARLDPAGDASPAVRQMRQAIADGLRRNDELEAKPRPRP